MATYHPRTSYFLIILLFTFSVAECFTVHESAAYLPHQRLAIENPPLFKRQNNSNDDLNQARKLVLAAVEQQSIYNAYRVAHPRRNTYTKRPTGNDKGAQNIKRDDGPTPPVLTEALQNAAALLAEHTAAQQLANGTLHKPYEQFESLPVPLNASSSLRKRATTNYWAAHIDHGQAPMGSNPSYPVYRDVTDPKFGAKGDGVTDDTAAINKAIAYGNNCGAGCESSSIKGTFIYFPPGTYLISSPINAYYYSQLVGDPLNMPIIKTSASFIGLGAIQSDVYIDNGNGAEWYIVQSNFYRQVRNFLIDITQTTTSQAAALHWQVGQATSVTNVYILASNSTNTTQMGIFTENGSGGFMSDVSIVGGEFGIFGGNQQFTVRNFQIEYATNASIALVWDWGWTWTGLYLSKSPVGILLRPLDSAHDQDPGSTYIMDSTFNEMDVAVLADFEKFTILDTSIIVLENCAGNTLLAMVSYKNQQAENIPANYVDFVVIGNVEDDSMSFGQYNYQRPEPDASLLGGDQVLPRLQYFTRQRPQYEDMTADQFVNVKSHGAVGNGVADDTAAIQAALNGAGQKVVYFPPGSYVITSTLVIPVNTLMTGQVWSQLVASGSYFGDMSNPKPMVQVGKPGDIGAIEISDMIFTSIGSLPGLILMEWNVQANKQGSAGMWDSHFRVGGAYGTKLQVANCPMNQPIQQGCLAATMMLHVTSKSNGYFENVWAWVADHDIDDAQNTQITVAVARGILMESQGPTWMYGTASEHSILYQYNFVNTTNTFAGMMQTESPYFQATTGTQSPGPYNSSVGIFSGDPIFPDPTCYANSNLCNVGWALIMNTTTNLTVAGAGFYSWFDNYVESCVDTQNCQQRIVLDAGGNQGLGLWNLITIGSVEMISQPSNNVSILAKNNTQATGHPYWSALAGYLDDSDTDDDDYCDGDDATDCFDDTPICDFTLSFPDMDALNTSSSNIPNECMGFTALDTLSNTLSGAMANYTNVNNGYDSVFSYYVEYVRDTAKTTVDDVMADVTATSPAGDAQQFFDCTIGGKKNPCPPNTNDLSGGYTLTYTLRDPTGFYNLMQSKYGIAKDWIQFINPPQTPCIPTTACGNNRVGRGMQGGDNCQCVPGPKIYGLPATVPYDQIDVTNPKDVITAALPGLNNLTSTILARMTDIGVGKWTGPMDDLLQVLSLPVLVIQSSVESMANAKQLGQQQQTEDKQKLISEILSAVFAVLPFLDEVAPLAIGFRGIYTLASSLGSIALAIQDMAADPSSIPMDIIGILLSVQPRTKDDFASLAAKRGELTEDEVTNIGRDFKAKNDRFQTLVKPKCH